MEYEHGCLCVCIILIFLGGTVCVNTTTEEDAGRTPRLLSYRTIRVKKDSQLEIKISTNLTTVGGWSFSLESESKYFRINEKTGDLYLSSSLSSFSGTTITLKIVGRHKTGFSQTVTVEIVIQDVKKIYVFLHRPDRIENGTDVNFTCEAHGFTKQPVFQWILSNKTVIPGRTDRIQVQTTLQETAWVSALMLRPVLYRDGDTVACSLTGSEDQVKDKIIRSTTFRVITKPVVVASPENVYIKNNDQVNLTCAVVDPPGMTVQMRWYRRQNGTEQLVSETTGLVLRHVYTVTGLNQDTEFFCEASNRDGRQRSNTVTVNKTKASSDVCPNGDMPLNNSAGDEIFCGRGPDREDCPSGSTCVIDSLDRFAFCCPPSASSHVCPNGDAPIANSAGNEIFCGRGPTREDCPIGSSCIIDPLDKFAFCCHVFDINATQVFLRTPDRIENGTNVTFTCEAHGFTKPPVFEWLQSNRTISPSDRIQVNTTQQELIWISVLSIRPVLYRDGGTITCRLMGSEGNVDYSRRRTVQFRVITKPVVVASPENVYIRRDEQVNLTCVMVDPPDTMAQIIWYRRLDGREIVVSATDGLVFRDVYAVSGVSQDTEFFCEGYNGDGQQRSNTVTVYLVTKDVCLNGDEPLTNSAGDEIFCGRGLDRENCPSGSTCVIDPLDRFAFCCPSPASSNVCPNGEAPLNNSAGEEIFCGRGPGRVDCPPGSTCVIDPLDRFAFCCHSSVIGVNETDVFLQTPDHIENGTDVNFTCEAHGFTQQPAFEWLLSNKTIFTGQTGRVQVNTTQQDTIWVSTLEFRPIVYSDGGTITCSLTGSENNVEYSITKSVQFHVITKPVVIASPEIVYIRTDQQINLTCVMVDPPDVMAKIRWYRSLNGTEVLVSATDGLVLRDVYTVTGGNQDTEFFCEGYNRDGKQRSNTVTVYIVTEDVCPNGEAPLYNSTGDKIFCGRGPDREDCPSGSTCVNDPLDRFAFCCPSSATSDVCPNGDTPLNNSAGDEIFCGRGPGREDCPSGSACVIDPLDRFAFCCPSSASSGLCPNGHAPLNNSAGEEIFCGRGPGREDCPSGSTCVIDSLDRFAFCCPTIEPPDLCPDGDNPLENSAGEVIFCGRGPDREDCPSGSTCVIDPLDRFAFCCSSSASSDVCPNGDMPLNNSAGDEIFCGRGPDREDCPSGNTCVIDPLDRFAFCCPSTVVDLNDTDVVFKTPERIENGTDISFTCEAHGFTAQPVFEWLLSNNTVLSRETGRIRINTSQQGMIWVSVLELRPVLYRDGGVVTCNLAGTEGRIKYKISRFLEFRVITKPVVAAKPKNVYIRSGQQVNLTCVMVDPPDMMAQMRWYRRVNGTEQLVSMTQGLVLRDVYTVTGVSQDTEFVCEGYNSDGQQRSNTVTVSIVTKDNKTCPQTTDENGVIWIETLTGTLEEAECPSGFTGTSSRRCNGDGQWEDVDYDTGCSQTSLDVPLRKAQQIKDGVFMGNLSDVLNDLEHATSSAFRTSSDIDTILEVLESITEGYSIYKNQSFQDEDVQRMLNIVDGMLAANASKWRYLMQSGRRGPRSLMWSVDRMAEIAIRGNSRFNKTFASDKVFFQIGSVIKDNIECPKRGGDYPEWLKEMNTSTQLLEESYPSQMKDGEAVWYSGVIYRDIGAVMDKQYLLEVDPENTPTQLREDMVMSSRGAERTSMKDVVSRIMSFSVFPRMERLNPPLYITLSVSRTNSEPICSFLNYNNITSDSRSGNWSSEGCELVARDHDVIVCACNHTTNFAILMSPVETVNDEHEYILSVISIVGCGVSLVFLVTTICIYCMVWRYMVKTHVARIKAILLMNLCVALIVSYTLFLAGVRLTQYKDICTAVAALLHYFFLVVFFVMLAEGIHLFISIVIVVNFTSYLKSLYILIWVTPAIVVGVTIGVVQVDGYRGQRFCWLSTEGHVIWAFVGPVLLIIMINMCILLMSLRQMMRRKSFDDKILKQGKYLARALAVILPLIGITWMIGVFAINRDLIVFQYLFAICNTLQGVFIFIFHCCTSNVRAAFMEMRNRFRRQSMSKSIQRTGSTYRTKSSHESYPSVKSNNSNYTLSLTTKALRNNGDPQEDQGASLDRVIALPALFDPHFERPTQLLIKKDSLGEQGTPSPTTLQFINLGFADATRKRVSFSVGNSPDPTYKEEFDFESPADFKGKRRRRSITFLPEEDITETEVERKLRQRRKAIDQMYEVCNAFTDLRTSKTADPSIARDRWRIAYNAIHSAKTFKVSSPPSSSVIQDTEMTSFYDPDGYFMIRM